MSQAQADSQPHDDESTIQEGMLLDYITGKPKKEDAKELVRQRIARALFHEYGISPDDIKPDYSIATEVDGKTRRRRVSLAIFHPGAKHTDENLGRVVVCQAEPKNGKISISSPVARALIGKSEGDEVQVRTPTGVRSFEILSVEYIE